MKIINNQKIILFIISTLFFCSHVTYAQTESTAFGFKKDVLIEETTIATTTSTTTAVNASETAATLIKQQQTSAPATDLTRPEELPGKVAIITLFEDRPVNEWSFFNTIAFWVQESVKAGVPANTIYLILLTPILALIVSFVRVVIGLPTLDMLVPIALSFVLMAVGISVGLLILGVILITSYFTKKGLSSLRIMFYPKRSLSLFFLAVAVFGALSFGVSVGIDRILSVSIFPILILLLLGDMIVSVQLHKSAYETVVITSTTIALGLLGFILATSKVIQDTIILYPEIILLVVPANIIIGRYFGLRVLEYFRFSEVTTD